LDKNKSLESLLENNGEELVQSVQARLKILTQSEVYIELNQSNNPILSKLRLDINSEPNAHHIKITISVLKDKRFLLIIICKDANNAFVVDEFIKQKYGQQFVTEKFLNKNLSAEEIANNYMNILETDLIGVLNGEWWPDIPYLNPRDMGY
jgi:hypothetical protein